MGVLNVPKAVYKAQQAKKQMSKIKAVGIANGISILVNGLNETDVVEVDETYIAKLLSDAGVNVESVATNKIKQALEKDIKDANSDAKKQLEKQLMSSTSLDDLKSLLAD